MKLYCNTLKVFYFFSHKAHKLSLSQQTQVILMNSAKTQSQLQNGFPATREDLSRRYTLKFAEDTKEIEQALRLRYSVFVEEMGEGCIDLNNPGLDTDLFDSIFHHLLIIDRRHSEVIGTYRMQSYAMAQENRGFYSATEYDLSQMPTDIITQSVEVGRACIAKKHRNGRVLFLLWKGLALYLQHHQARYFFGCCSLTSQDPEEGLMMYEHLKEEQLMHPDILIPTQPGFQCSLPDGHLQVFPKINIPRLMKIYLQYKATICSEPAIDRLFKTIDFLTLMDTHTMDASLRKQLFES